ncbi:hypothetical protein ACIQXI_04710 [Lysinibacillus sp. NPDC097195]|uniref:hypothetical protein n=1 Tax=Lysinibacillus sp. NPDC097195 TaxID=3364141 RepID=UPI003805787B
MNQYPAICFMGIIFLSGCSPLIMKSPQEQSKIIESEPVAIQDKQTIKDENISMKDKGIEVIRARMIDEHLVSTIGESKTYFQTYSDLKVKVHIENTGTEGFIYKIRNLEDYQKVIVSGILKTNESFQQVFDQLPEGFYAISTVVEEEDMPIQIDLSLKVDLIEYE